jgi:outer membrane protein OmpA-like peptidoglycan-associated protein
MVVENPTKNSPGSPPRKVWKDVHEAIRRLSSWFGVRSSGEVHPTNSAACKTASRTTDRCLCDLHRAKTVWTIKLSDTEWPSTSRSDKWVTFQSSRSVAQYGAWGKGKMSGKRILPYSRERVLGHELCGHAWLEERKNHPAIKVIWKRGKLYSRPYHERTVNVENVVAREIHGPGVALRGGFKDPHHGESFARVTVAGFPTNSSKTSDLSKGMRKRLQAVRAFMGKSKRVKADVIGHADNTGKRIVNDWVSLKRARSVRDHLRKLGVHRKRFRAILGKANTECPSTPRKNPACRKADVFMFVYEAASERSK